MNYYKRIFIYKAAYPLFGLTTSILNKRKIKITDIIPEFFANINDFCQKGGMI